MKKTKKKLSKRQREQDALADITSLVDETIAPEEMTKQEAFDFLEELTNIFEGQMDCLRDEMRNA